MELYIRSISFSTNICNIDNTTSSILFFYYLKGFILRESNIKMMETAQTPELDCYTVPLYTFCLKLGELKGQT